ncbi:MFS transporter [Blastochloris viridis]|uniref:AmpG permease n=1 Tax=Blastochloris viridis TaxID=1079 RepID=A0A0H5BE69_BLAVI|nr:MFS transporter [Blastochloris viridis]ALK09612.1 muropeptide transporter [Blastochloris viridis]BAS00498.1 AmpG permease [Blastochloris viridis]CUU42275.1 muropeptide transporter [Blastochloris viridis]
MSSPPLAATAEPRSAGRATVQAVAASTYAAAMVAMFFIYTILPATLRQAGHPPEVVGMVFLAYLPYALRVAWAPLVERWAAGQASRHRAALRLFLIAAVLAMLALLAVDPATSVWPLLGLSTLVVTLLVTAMTASDAYLVAMVGAADRQRSAVQQGIAAAAGGTALGVAMLVLGDHGWRGIVVAVATLSFVVALPALMLPDRLGERLTATAGPQRAGLWTFFNSPVVRRRLAISVFVHGAFGLASGALPILQVDAGLSVGEIGLLSAVGANIVGLAASLLVGAGMVRFGAWRALAALCVASLVGFGTAAVAGSAIFDWSAVIALTFLVMGTSYAFFVVYRALTLIVCQGERAATQAAALACADSLISIVAATASGAAIAALGLNGLFAVVAALVSIGTVIAVVISAGPEVRALLRHPSLEQPQ